MIEIYVPVENHKRYYVSNYGNIISCNKNKKIKRKITIDKYGYNRCALYKSKRGNKDYLIHRLVYEHFNKNIPKNMQINHIDGNKSNNYINNLECVTAKENVNHAWSIGLHEYARKIAKDTMINKIHKLNKKNKHKKYWVNGQKAAVEKAIEINRRPVECILDGVVINKYDSIKKASVSTGVDASKISKICRNKYKYNKKYDWRYI